MPRFGLAYVFLFLVALVFFVIGLIIDPYGILSFLIVPMYGSIALAGLIVIHALTYLVVRLRPARAPVVNLPPSRITPRVLVRILLGLLCAMASLLLLYALLIERDIFSEILAVLLY